MKWSCVLPVLLLCMFSQCSRTESDTPIEGDIVGGAGTVTFLGLEGGFYGIVTDDGENYDPINLPSAFRKDGLRVMFKGKVRTELGSYHQWGTIVELSYVQKL